MIGFSGAVPDKGGEIDFGGVYIHRGTVGERIVAAPDHFVTSFVIARHFAVRVIDVEVDVQAASENISRAVEGVYREYAHYVFIIRFFGRRSGVNIVNRALFLPVFGYSVRHLGFVKVAVIGCHLFIGHFDFNLGGFRHEPGIGVVVGIPLP